MLTCKYNASVYRRYIKQKNYCLGCAIDPLVFVTDALYLQTDKINQIYRKGNLLFAQANVTYKNTHKDNDLFTIK